MFRQPTTLAIFLLPKTWFNNLLTFSFLSLQYDDDNLASAKKSWVLKAISTASHLQD
jgi:hypothetical protein